ncbi:hypothetical protein [Agrobacterium pusense]|uniref:hypothetical protein n=1 Tax=Agrobacterium pusense TaxID=648995 RepID=UPI003FD5E81D
MSKTDWGAEVWQPANAIAAAQRSKAVFIQFNPQNQSTTRTMYLATVEINTRKANVSTAQNRTVTFRETGQTGWGTFSGRCRIKPTSVHWHQ